MEKSKTFQDLIVWQKAHAFVLKVYKVTESFPKYEVYELTSQSAGLLFQLLQTLLKGIEREALRTS